MPKIKMELTEKQINSKKEKFEERINSSIEAKKAGKTNPTKKFLMEIKSLLKKAIENGVGYKQIAKDILEVYNFKVSEQTIRTFAYNELGVEKRTRKKNNISNSEMKSK